MTPRDNQYTLKEAIEQLIRAYGFTDKLLETTVINSWEQVVGGVYAAHTQHLQVKNKTLFVQMDTPALRQDLSMEKTAIIKKLNNRAGKPVIEEIVFR